MRILRRDPARCSTLPAPRETADHATAPTSRFHAARVLLTAARLAAALSAALAFSSPAWAAPADAVVLVTLDGFRREDFFGGFSRELDSKPAGGVMEPGDVARRFARPTVEGRREALLPFLWTVVAREGQILGDPDQHSAVTYANGLFFSYPGYSEMLTGKVDPRIDSNDERPNPNLTVLAWLGARPGFQGRVAMVAPNRWFTFIVGGADVPVAIEAGPPWLDPATDAGRVANDLIADLPDFGHLSIDAPAMSAALESVATRHPRVLWVALNETDAWGHQRRYDLYLDAAHRADRFLRRLWEALQASPEYRGHTTLIVTTDHGRGEGERWTGHGRGYPTAGFGWIAVLGPRTPALGVRQDVSVTVGQVAATVAGAVGEDFTASGPGVAGPLPGAVR